MSSSLPIPLPPPPDLYPVLPIGAGFDAIANMTTKVEADIWVQIVNTTILSLTIAGALGILGSMVVLEMKGRPATTRTRIVQSLVISDLVLGITGLIGSAIDLSNHGLKPGSTCDGLGLVLVAVLWTQHLWSLALAFATFLILIYPLHYVTLLLEKRWYLLWALVWIISIAVGILGYELYGYKPSGGICYYPSKSGLYGELIQFVPRGIVFAFITFFYARLFVFLRRPDKIRSPYSDPPNTSYSKDHSTIPGGRRRRRLSTHLKLSPRGEKITEPAEPKSFDLGSPRPFEPFPQITPLVSPLREVPLAPWERVELPVFQVEGQRYGGTSAPVNGNIWGNWMGLSGKEQKNRPSIGSSTSPPAQTISRVGSHSTDTTHPSPLFFNTPRLESIPSVMDPDQVLALPGKRKMSADFGSMSPLERIRKGSAIFTLISEPQIVTPSASSVHLSGQQESYDPHVRRASALTQQSRRSFNDPSQAKREFLPVPQPSLSERDSPEVEAQQHADEDDRWDLLRVLQQTAPPKTANDRFAPGEGEVVEFVEESMASYLNRKTALLMLWFPLGYVLLVSVSLIRIIYDFAGDPPTSLRAISRWMIFSQGVLDALIYGLVEWHTKRVVRRRVRKGTFSPSGSAEMSGARGSGLGSVIRALGSRRSEQASQANSKDPLSSRLGQNVSFATPSRIDEDPRSILQESELGDRKGSSFGSDETKGSSG